MLYNLFENRDFVSVFAVALLAEGVDRNTDRSVNAYNAYRKDSIIKLTRKGVDLVEGTINDPGIDV